MASRKVKEITIGSRLAYVLKETLDAQKPESLRDARYYMSVVDALSGAFNFSTFTTIHKRLVKELEEAREAKQRDKISPEQDKLLHMTNDEWFALLHEEMERAGGASVKVRFAVDAVTHVTHWLEKQTFNMLGARLMVQFCDLVEAATETIEGPKKEE